MCMLRVRKYFYYLMLRILGWRPIISAPIDGTKVLILEECNLAYWNVFQAQYIDEQPYPGWRGIYIAKYVGTGLDEPHYVDKPIITTPDFWKPLPKAPKFYKWWILTENKIQVKIEEKEE